MDTELRFPGHIHISSPWITSALRCSELKKKGFREHNQKTNSSVERVDTFYLLFRHLRCPEKLQHIWEPVVLGEGRDG